MRNQQDQPRGEARRVAERVRSVLAEHESRQRPKGGSDWTDDEWPGSGGRPAAGWVEDGAVELEDDLTEDDLADDDIADDDQHEPDLDLGRWTAGRHGITRSVMTSPRLLDRLPVRVDPGRRGALGVGLAVLLVAAVAAVWLLAQHPRSVPVSASGPDVAGASVLALSATPDTSPGASAGAASGASSGASPSAGTTEVVVDVAGKVRRPGLYRLRSGARIDDALAAAGGPVHGANLDSLNLAAPLVDGQQIVVGLPGASAGQLPAAGTGGSAGSGAATGTGAAGQVVNLNSADLDQLQTLPGIGPVLAQHILDWRTEHGSFASVDQLNDVSGIGEVKFAALKSLVSV